MKFAAAVLPLGLAAVASAAPTSKNASTGRVINVVDALIQAVPESASCDTPEGREFPGECRDAEQVAPRFVESLLRYGVYEVNQIAAILALVAHESRGFQANKNKTPGNPGQGTVNMQSPDYNVKFANTFPELQEKFGDFTTYDAMPADKQQELMTSLNDDKYNFATGAWFFSTQCQDDDIKNLMLSDPDAGFLKYVGTCVGAGDADSPERWARWEAAKAAFGVA